MKQFALLTFGFLLILFSSQMSAQEMKPEAGKHFNEGNEKLKAGDFQGAITSYDHALQVDQDYRIYYQKGIALKKLGKNQESVPVLQEVIKLNPKFDGAYNALGGSFFSLGQMEEAIKNFEKVVEVSSNATVKNKAKEYLARSYAKLGRDQLSNGDAGAAIVTLNKAVQLFNYDAAYLTLAQAYYENGEYDKSIAASENALKYRNTISKGGPYYYMGVAYKMKGNMTKAKDNFNLAKADVSYKKIAEYELGLIK